MNSELILTFLYTPDLSSSLLIRGQNSQIVTLHKSSKGRHVCFDQGRKWKKARGKDRPKHLISQSTVPNNQLSRAANPLDLCCPICKEIVERPIQTACQHMFRFKFIEEWLHYTGDVAKCPTCIMSISPEKLENVCSHRLS